MIYPISGDSAIQYWQTCSYAGQELNYVNNSMLFSDKDLTDKDFYLSQILSFADRNSIRAPVHILTGQESRRHKGKDFITHLAPADLPLKSIVELQGPVYIVSPELCFLLAAREKTFPELVKIGYDLCAIYVTAPREEFLQRTRVPLTTAAKLNEFINSAHNINGIVAAKKALKYILDNSNSPMETKMAFIAILPFSMGGYNLPYPFLNPVIRLSPEGSRLLGFATCRGDLVWTQGMVDLEYDSNLSHLSPEQHSTDKKRASALALSGYTVISATADQFHHFRDIDALFASVRNALKLKPRNELLDKYRDKRWELLRQVFHSDFRPI